MKAVTLHQPWASLVRDGHKTIETRSWPAPKALLGQRIAIHAGKRPIDVDDWPDELYDEICEIYPDWIDGPRERFPLGVIVATAVLARAAQVVHLEDDFEPPIAYFALGSPPKFVRTDEFGDFSEGRWLWMLRDIEPFEPPVPARGSQGLWEWEPPIAAVVDGSGR